MQDKTLLNSFIFVAKYYGKDITQNSILSQLPKFDGDIPYAYVGRVSQKLHFDSKIIKQKDINIDVEFLPVIAKLVNDKFCVIVGYQDDKIIIQNLHLKNSLEYVTKDRFYEIFDNEIILIKPSLEFYKYHTNKSAITDLNPKNWFIQSIMLNKGLYAQLILTTIMINLMVLALPMFTLNVYDRVIPNNAIDTLWVLSITVIIALILDFILKFLRVYFLSDAGKKTDILVSLNIFDHLMNLKLEQKPVSTGIFVNTLQSFEKVREFLTSATMVTIIDMPFALLFMGIIFLVGGPLAYIPLITAIIIIFIALVTQQRLKPIVAESFTQSKIKHGNLVESVYGLETIKATGAQNRMSSRWETSIKDTTNINHKINVESKVSSSLIATVVQMSSIALVGIGSYMAIVDKSITMGVIIATMILNGRAMAPIAQFVGILSQFNMTLSSYKALDDFMKLEDDRYTKEQYVTHDTVEGNIVFDNVSFRYPEAQFDNLKDINLNIKSGEKVAILGQVGSGKSTLIKLIANLYAPTSGSLMLDGTEMRNLDPHDINSFISLIPQDIVLFSGNLRDNISVGYQHLDDKKLLEITTLVGLDGIISKHKKGLDMIIGERGDGLSGGEKKSVTIARALASDTKILLADEPTDSIDSQTENRIIKNLKETIKDKTFIVVTHKPSVLRLVDRIIIMKNGRIVQDGPKNEVLKSIRGKK
ncbi:ABC transporter, transmembrane region:ABC transporter:Peptidase C39, bacteriocin processing [hydrothermal vent metagenome]|uniref:ABC transporter, transmembrane region:ABC transporter:Peptidase C39, bacteriocin processing n=1 Tax=hydrothermal vent metagenome TaxID=652676 RepID=A0A1W1EIA2_9ZZZZ